MIRRCTDQKHVSYSNYGARGIYVCSRWVESFDAFLSDMGPRPIGTSIDRIDNDGPYTPENCRWATTLEQSSNRRTTKNFTLDGKTQSCAAWARDKGISPQVLHYRMNSLGLPFERAIVMPASRRRKAFMEFIK